MFTDEKIHQMKANLLGSESRILKEKISHR